MLKANFSFIRQRAFAGSIGWIPTITIPLLQSPRLSLCLQGVHIFFILYNGTLVNNGLPPGNYFGGDRRWSKTLPFWGFSPPHQYYMLRHLYSIVSTALIDFMSPAKEKEKKNHRNMRLHGKWSRRSANNILININDDELAFSLFIGVHTCAKKLYCFHPAHFRHFSVF